MEKENLIVESGRKFVEGKLTELQQKTIDEVKETELPVKIQASSMYGKFGDMRRDFTVINEPSMVTDSGRSGFAIIPDQMIMAHHLKQGAEFTSELTEEEMTELIMRGDEYIAARGSDKTRMSLKAIAEALNIPEDKLILASSDAEGSWENGVKFAIMPDNFEGFEPGKVVVVDSMGDLHSGVHSSFSMQAMAEKLETQTNYEMRLSRTEKRKQQRARAAEERKLRKQLKKDAKNDTTIHQTLVEADQLNKNNTVYPETVLRGASAGIHYDDSWE